MISETPEGTFCAHRTQHAVRAVLRRHGWNATAYQIVNPGIDHWFSSGSDAVVGFIETASTRIVAGGPVCSKECLDRVVREWEHASACAGKRVCYFGASSRLQSLLQHSPEHAVVSVGSQPVWNPMHWADRTARHVSLRAQFRRARNHGVQVTEWDYQIAERSTELRACLNSWLQTRGMPSLHFLVEPQTLSRLQDKRIFVATQNGRVVAFLTLSPVPARNGWLTEQFPRIPGAPNGTVELLIDAAARAIAVSGSNYLTMGLVPMSRHGHSRAVHNPLWHDAALRLVRSLGSGYYNFSGLDAFKSKFNPEYWEPIYAISREKTFSPRTLCAVAAAFTAHPRRAQ